MVDTSNTQGILNFFAFLVGYKDLKDLLSSLSVCLSVCASLSLSISAPLFLSLSVGSGGGGRNLSTKLDFRDFVWICGFLFLLGSGKSCGL